MSDSPKREPSPVVFGCKGTSLTSDERSFFQSANPFGIILFKRNCETPNQVRWLVKEIRLAVGRDDVAILIDQEGGRVTRLQPPEWPSHPAARLFGIMYETDPDWGAEAIQCYARLVAHELTDLGITMNCAPVVDLFMPGATTAIGDRAISRQPAVVAAIARLWAETLLNSGILPVIKHIPGHGRLKTDPHLMLPAIEASRAELESDDFIPFELLKDLPIAMNSHAVFMALDPEQPASLSTIIHQDIIRGVLGFDGLILSDDITMKALHGLPSELARRALEAGNDIILHCDASLEDMKAISLALPPMRTESLERWQHAQNMVKIKSQDYTPSADSARLDLLLGAIAYTHKDGVAT